MPRSDGKHGFRRLRLLAFVSVALIVPACSGGDDGAPGPAGPPGVVIHSITANPPVIRPGESTVLTVSATDGTAGTITYTWTAGSGLLSSASGNPVTWTAPTTVGTYLVNMTVSNAGGSAAAGAVSLLVSVSPGGPIITSVNPNPVRPGQVLRITGAGFGAAQGTSTVTVAGAAATAVSWSDVEIQATVPTNSAATGDVIATIGGVQSSPLSVSVLWPQGNPVNVAISTATNSQSNCQIVSDGAGGAIIAWTDFRNGTNDDIFAQRVSATGAPLWTLDGVAVSTAANGQSECQIVSDGAGGAIIAWRDFRNGNDDIFAQRVSAAGAPLWTADGVAISTAADGQFNCRLISDGAGGAIIAWQDLRNASTFDIFAQRVSAAGAPQWTADGVAISTAADGQSNCRLVSDGAGGAIIAWEDYRNGTNHDIFAQRVSAAGAPQWTADGVGIVTLAQTQSNCQIASDGAGGAIIAWMDLRNGLNYDIFAQRVSAAGAPQWQANGMTISSAANSQLDCRIVSDGAGGAIIAWEDYRSGVRDIYGQRVSATGITQWTIQGVAISTAVNEQFSCQIVSDGAGGAIISWEENRSGWGSDIFAQRVSAAGAPQWTADGLAISNAAEHQQACRIASDGAGGAIIAWDDNRSGTIDLYAQRVTADGQQ